MLKCEGYKLFFIEERRDDKAKLLRRRIKKLGLISVMGQIIFMVFSYLQGRTKKVKNRLKDIEYTVTSRTIDIDATAIFPNVNSTDAITAINNISPDYVILSGTRILDANFLSNVRCPILNIHAGINPAYRGVHGGYWALVNKQPELFGATIHIVDEGVDTGSVLCHARITPGHQDNFSTYPLLQMSAALKCLPGLLNRLSNKQQSAFIPELSSNIWTHPTIWQYILYRIRKGIK